MKIASLYTYRRVTDIFGPACGPKNQESTYATAERSCAKFVFTNSATGITFFKKVMPVGSKSQIFAQDAQKLNTARRSLAALKTSPLVEWRSLFKKVFASEDFFHKFVRVAYKFAKSSGSKLLKPNLYAERTYLGHLPIVDKWRFWPKKWVKKRHNARHCLTGVHHLASRYVPHEAIVEQRSLFLVRSTKKMIVALRLPRGARI